MKVGTGNLSERSGAPDLSGELEEARSLSGVEAPRRT